MGKRTKCNPEVTERVRQAILGNAPQVVAAARGGIGERTHFEWMARGRASLEQSAGETEDVPENERPFAEYAHTIQEALREWELRQLAIIARGAQGLAPTSEAWQTTTTSKTERVPDQRTGEIREVMVEQTVVEKRGLPGNTADAKWMLERRLPQQYGRVWRAEVTGPEGKPIEVTLDERIAAASEKIDELAARRERRIASGE